MMDVKQLVLVLVLLLVDGPLVKETALVLVLEDALHLQLLLVLVLASVQELVMVIVLVVVVQNVLDVLPTAKALVEQAVEVTVLIVAELPVLVNLINKKNKGNLLNCKFPFFVTQFLQLGQ